MKRLVAARSGMPGISPGSVRVCVPVTMIILGSFGSAIALPKLPKIYTSAGD